MKTKRQYRKASTVDPTDPRTWQVRGKRVAIPISARPAVTHFVTCLYVIANREASRLASKRKPGKDDEWNAMFRPSYVYWNSLRQSLRNHISRPIVSIATELHEIALRINDYAQIEVTSPE